MKRHAAFELLNFLTIRPDLVEIPYAVRETAARSTYLPRWFKPTPGMA
jgi:hypothetical protein